MSPLTRRNASRLHTSFCIELYNQAPAKMMIYIIYIHTYVHTHIYTYTGRDLLKGEPLSEPRIHVWINLCIRGFLTASATGGDWVSEWWMDLLYSILNIRGGEVPSNTLEDSTRASVPFNTRGCCRSAWLC